MSKYLDEMKIGQTIKVRGPKGAFKYEKGMVDAFGMVAGGTGITPMYQVGQRRAHEVFELSLTIESALPCPIFHGSSRDGSFYFQVALASLRDPTDKTKFRLIYANNTEADILLRDELDGLAKKYPERFSVYYVLLEASLGVVPQVSGSIY